MAGAGGVVGSALVPELLRRGHVVAGLVHSSSSGARIAAMGAEPVIENALDSKAVTDRLCQFKPEAVVHQLTALPADTDLRDFDRIFAETNRLRTAGTDILIAAARKAGSRRFVAQSFCGWPYERAGGPIKTESDPLDPNPPRAFARTLAALRYLEAAVDKAEDIHSVSLRYGAFYGPGTFIGPGGALVEQVQKRRFPIVGRGGGIWSFVHVADVATATAAAVESNHAGTFNVVDDEPAPVVTWLPVLASALGAKAPLRIPKGLARMLMPKHLLLMMTDVRGGSNVRFKQTFGWEPGYATWRQGFLAGIER